MDEGFRFIDIILFALVAAFIVLRLRSVLGRRTGHERSRPAPLQGSGPAGDENVIPLPDHGDDEAEADEALGDNAAPAGLAQIKIADPTFDTKGFLAGARKAYEMVIASFAAGDRDTLRPLLNDEVYRNFEGAIAAREARNESLESTLVSINSADIVAARMTGSRAEITIEFVCEIIKLLRDAAGKVIEGDTRNVRRVTDIWTFARDTAASSPNWTLIETRSAT